MKRVQIRMKTAKDTLHRCEELDQDWGLYFEGYTQPHFSVPARVIDVLITEDVVYMASDSRLAIICRRSR